MRYLFSGGLSLQIRKSFYFARRSVATMKKVAVISAILEDPEGTQHAFNDTVASFKGITKGDGHSHSRTGDISGIDCCLG